jgi:nucleoside-diphosphate-sugar epimerase
MKFLITGSPGWLGDRFVQALQGGLGELKSFVSPQMDEIRCLVQPDFESRFKKDNPKIRPITGDITRKDSLNSFFENTKGAILFHLAGVVHASKGVKQFFDVNVEGTKNLLDFAVNNGVRRILVVSSNSSIGCNPFPEHFFTEETPFNPYMAYGRSKMQMEMLVQEAFYKKKIETVILRPCWFYGPGQPSRQTRFFSIIKNGKAPIGENKRSMSYVDNVCQALLMAALNNKANGETYWITDKQPYMMNQIVDTIEKLLEKEFCISVAHKRLKLPLFVCETALVADAVLQKIGIYHQQIHVLSEANKTIAASSAKAERDFGFSPLVGLEEGMRRSIRWCLDNGLVI